jgi:hypothetical protein
MRRIRNERQMPGYSERRQRLSYPTPFNSMRPRNCTHSITLNGSAVNTQTTGGGVQRGFFIYAVTCRSMVSRLQTRRRLEGPAMLAPPVAMAATGQWGSSLCVHLARVPRSLVSAVAIGSRPHPHYARSLARGLQHQSAAFPARLDDASSLRRDQAAAALR